MRAALVFCLGLAVSVPQIGTAQEVVGTSVLKGRKVELLSDKTWRFSELETAKGCVAVHKSVDFCGSILDWRPRSTTGSEFTALFYHDDRHMAGVIIEDLGAKDDYTYPFMRQAVLQMAADASLTQVENIPVLSIEDIPLDSKPAEEVVYGVILDGVSMVFANRIMILEGMTIQVISWAVGKDFTDKHRELHENFTSNVKISYEAETQ